MVLMNFSDFLEKAKQTLLLFSSIWIQFCLECSQGNQVICKKRDSWKAAEHCLVTQATRGKIEGKGEESKLYEDKVMKEKIVQVCKKEKQDNKTYYRKWKDKKKGGGVYSFRELERNVCESMQHQYFRGVPMSYTYSILQAFGI